jgi:hypothetical protein
MKRLTRAESFLGVHFDFHASPDNEIIGARSLRKTLARLLRSVAPDYVQCDCKGHPGISSYPTKVGNPAPKFAGDPLRIWREETARQGVALFMHYSGVWDTTALARHPEWARIDETGKTDPNNTSVFGDYVQKLMIPQLVELREKYGVDGFWVDGDCWATCQDYHPAVLAEFRRRTGIRKIPRKKGDVGFYEFTEFCREAFREYVRTYVNALHERCPGVQVASNWAFSSFMPEPVSIPVDFLSGDYPLSDSVNAARFDARCLMHQGLPWDLMAWAFSGSWAVKNFTAKPAIQMFQEAGVVLALGGGFQMYFQQQRDGSIAEEEIAVMADVARFCRSRQRFCHEATSIPQVALLLSKEWLYRQISRVFGAWDGEHAPLQGILGALMDNQYCVDVVSEHHLKGQMARYPAIVVPEQSFLDEDFRSELLAYARGGGSLLVIGAEASLLFREELGLETNDVPIERERWVASAGGLAGLKTKGLELNARRPARVTGKWHETGSLSSPTHPAVVRRRFGKGQLASLCLDFGTSYKTARTFQAREFFGGLMAEVFPAPIVKVTGSHHVDVTLMRKGADLFVHLVNTSGSHDNPNIFTIDEVPPIRDLRVTLRLKQKPGVIRLQPDGIKLKFQWRAGICTLTVPEVAVHAILQIEKGAESHA